MVVTRFSNSADATVGRVVLSVPGGTSVVDEFVTSMGDCTMLVAHTMLSAERLAQFALETP